MTNDIREGETVNDTEHDAASGGAEAPDATAATPTGNSGGTEPAEKAIADSDDAGEPADVHAQPIRSRKRWLRVAAAVAVAAVIAGGALGFVKYKSVADQLAALRQAQADRDTAARLAKDYALKSLTYSFEDPDAFFRSVEDGVAQPLKDKFVNATPFLKQVMLLAQVSSTGEVVATDAVAQPGGVYQVVVSANQTTRNLQRPEPRVSVILLQVIVNKVGNTWQIADIGPKTGNQPANADLFGPSESGPLPGPSAPPTSSPPSGPPTPKP